MPELIDLEVARENMMKRVGGKKVDRLLLVEEKVLRNADPDDMKLPGLTLNDISRIAKLLVFDFGERSLVFHLMLHGDFCWKDGKKSEKNVVFSIEFESGDTVLVKDWSRWMKVELHDPEAGFVSELLEKKYGVDPLGEDFSEEILRLILTSLPRSGIKKVLMDQEKIAGIGNAYADEILYDAKIHPKTTCKKIVEGDNVGRLFSSVKRILESSLEEVRVRANGSISEQDRDFMKVYRKSGTSCPRCKYMIACLKVNGRDTFVCEKCQEKA